MRSNELVYLAGPITAAHGVSVAENVAAAVDVYWQCVRAGIPAFCPQIGAMFPQAWEIPYETWMAYDFAIIDRCTALLALPRWELSAGATREVQYALVRGMRVFYSLEELIASSRQER